MSTTDDYASDSGRYSSSDMRRRLLAALMKSDASPVASGWQGASRLAEALVEGLGYARAGKEEQDAAAQLAKDVDVGLRGRGGGAVAPDTGPATTGSISGGGGGGIDVAATENYIRQAAQQRGIDPDVAVQVAKSEGLAPGVYQSNLRGPGGGRETSYGPFQLYTGGGLGNKFQQTTGLDPRDPKTVQAQVDFALDQAKQGGWGPWHGAQRVGIGNWQGINRGQAGGAPQDMAGAALPGVVPVGSAPAPDVAAFLGTGKRPTIPGGPAEMMTPAPIGRGAVAQPVPGTPPPTRPTVTGDPAIAAQRIPPPTTPPVAATQVPQPIPSPSAQAPVAMPQPNPIDARIAAAVPPGVPSADIMPPVMSADLARLPQASPGPPIQPPAAPVARTPVPRPAPAVASPVVPSAAGPATTAAIPQQRGQIFREPYPSVLSAQEFARQGQNYLTGRASFANQARVAPRTMQEPVGAGLSGGAPGAAVPVSPRQGLIQRLFGGGGGGGAAAAQAAPAGSAVAGTGQPVDARRAALARVLANPNAPAALKTLAVKELYPEPTKYGFTTMPDGTLVRTNPDTGAVAPTGIKGMAPTDSFRPMTDVERASYGIQPDDKKAYKINTRTNEPEAIGSGGITNVIGAGETEYAKTRGKSLATQFETIQNASTQAQSKMATLDAMEQALGKTDYTGWGAPQLLEVKRAAKLFGIDTGDTGAAETAQAISNQLAMQLRNPSGGAGMPGAMSDADRNFLKASVLGIERTPGGNAQLLDYNRRLAQRDIEVAQQASDYAAAHGGMLDDGFGAELARWSKANPLFPEAKAKAGATSGGLKWTVEP